MLSVSSPSALATLDHDLLQELLRDKRSPNTRRTYAKGLRDFFLTMIQKEPAPQDIAWFLSLKRVEAVFLVLRYRACLVEKGLTPATVNVRLAAIKSLVNYARKVGKCDYSLEDVEGLRVETYRDTRGVTPDGFKQMTAQVNVETLKGKRDIAILRLLWDNALRRAEVCSLNIEDYQPGESQLLIKGKGKLTKEPITLSSKAIYLISEWLGVIGDRSLDNPLFCTVDRATFGHRLSGNAILGTVIDWDFCPLNPPILGDLESLKRERFPQSWGARGAK